ncbi:hypothetical protein ACHQM5_019491 [Ranunculus cassubicifolius]
MCHFSNKKGACPSVFSRLDPHFSCSLHLLPHLDAAVSSKSSSLVLFVFSITFFFSHQQQHTPKDIIVIINSQQQTKAKSQTEPQRSLSPSQAAS